MTSLFFCSISQLHNLVKLKLRGNNFQYFLARDIFSGLSSLSELDVSECKLERLPKRLYVYILRSLPLNLSEYKRYLLLGHLQQTDKVITEVNMYYLHKH